MRSKYPVTRAPALVIEPRTQTPFLRRHRRIVPCILASLLLHVLAVVEVGDWRRDQDAAASFKARLRQVARFEPQRLAANRPDTAPTQQLEYRGVRRAADPLQAAAALPQLEAPAVPEAETALRRFELAARPETFRADPEDPVERALQQMLARRDSMRQESLELLRVQDMAQGRERAAVLVDPTSRRRVTGFLNLTRLSVPGAGGGRFGGLEALARHMRDFTSLLVQVRPEAARLDDAELIRDPVLFLVEGGGEPLWQDWPPIRLTAEDRAGLERYMRAGGLVYFEGTYRYLGYVVGIVEELLGADASIRPLPANHPLYHAFYSYPSGFPGENKQTYAHLKDLPARGWDYPGARRTDEPALVAAPANLSEDLAEEPTLDALGLWGVELGDTLVAVISDLRLVSGWAASQSNDDARAGAAAPSLYAGTNLVVHALTRTGSVAPQRALPAWMRSRPRTRPTAAAADSGPTEALAAADPELYDALDATLAIVRAPLGTPLGPGGVRVRVDGQHGVEVLRGSRHGILLHNLDPGSHWVELEYDGKTEGIEVQLDGGRVTTVTFSVSRFAMLHSVELAVQEERVGLQVWRTTFADLDTEEVFLGAEPGLPAPPE